MAQIARNYSELAGWMCADRMYVENNPMYMCMFNLHYAVWFAENDVSFGL